jgi:hypothetical protein
VLDDQDREHCARPSPADLERNAVAEDRDLAEDTERERHDHSLDVRHDVDLRLPDCCRAAVSDTEGEVVTRSVARAGADPPEGDQDMSQQLHRIRSLLAAAILGAAVAAINVAPALAGGKIP